MDETRDSPHSFPNCRGYWHFYRLPGSPTQGTRSLPQGNAQGGVGRLVRATLGQEFAWRAPHPTGKVPGFCRSRPAAPDEAIGRVLTVVLKRCIRLKTIAAWRNPSPMRPPHKSRKGGKS